MLVSAGKALLEGTHEESETWKWSQRFLWRWKSARSTDRRTSESESRCCGKLRIVAAVWADDWQLPRQRELLPWLPLNPLCGSGTMTSHLLFTFDITKCRKSSSQAVTSRCAAASGELSMAAFSLKPEIFLTVSCSQQTHRILEHYVNYHLVSRRS